MRDARDLGPVGGWDCVTINEAPTVPPAACSHFCRSRHTVPGIRAQAGLELGGGELVAHGSSCDKIGKFGQFATCSIFSNNIGFYCGLSGFLKICAILDIFFLLGASLQKLTNSPHFFFPQRSRTIIYATNFFRPNLYIEYPPGAPEATRARPVATLRTLPGYPSP